MAALRGEHERRHLGHRRIVPGVHRVDALVRGQRVAERFGVAEGGGGVERHRGAGRSLATACILCFIARRRGLAVAGHKDPDHEYSDSDDDHAGRDEHTLLIPLRHVTPPCVWAGQGLPGCSDARA